MEEFEEFGIRLFLNHTEEGADPMSHDRNRSHFTDQSHGCLGITEIFPSPVDIYEVRKAWYGDQSCVSENIADDGGRLCITDDSTGAHRQGHGSCRTGPEDSTQRTSFNTIPRSCRTDSRVCLQRSVSSTEKVIGPCRTVTVSDSTTRASSAETSTAKLPSVGVLSTSLPSSSSSSSSPTSAADDGQPASLVTDAPTVQLEQAVYRVRSFSTDNGSVLNLGDSFKVFNRLLLLTGANNNDVEQPRVYQTPLRESNTVTAPNTEESEFSVTATAKRSASTRSETRRTAYKTAGRNTRHRSAVFRDSDRSEFSDAETGDANDERKELLKHDGDDRNSSEDEEDGYELLRKIAFPAIPSPEDVKKRSSSGASIALRSLGCEDDSSGSLNPPDGASLPQEGDDVGHWAGDSLLRVRLIGSQGVGKTTLTQQLMTSEYRPTDLVTSSGRIHTHAHTHIIHKCVCAYNIYST